MLRRILAVLAILVAGAAAGALFAPQQPAVSQTAKFVLKGQSSHPASANVHLIFRLWADTVEKMSNGRLKVETLPAGAIVPAFEVFDATSKGVLDVGMAPFATSRAATQPPSRCRTGRCSAWTAATTTPGTTTATA